jgi:hypothetical protein
MACNMKILLQNVQTRRYFNLLGLWTANPNFAYNFRHSHSALDFVRKNEITDVQLVVTFADSQSDEIVPLPFRAAALSPATN